MWNILFSKILLLHVVFSFCSEVYYSGKFFFLCTYAFLKKNCSSEIDCIMSQRCGITIPYLCGACIGIVKEVEWMFFKREGYTNRGGSSSVEKGKEKGRGNSSIVQKKKKYLLLGVYPYIAETIRWLGHFFQLTPPPHLPYPPTSAVSSVRSPSYPKFARP